MTSPEPEQTLDWVGSFGGPLIVVPESVLADWGGVTPYGVLAGDGTAPDDYDRACRIRDFAAVIPVGRGTALVLGDAPDQTAYLPQRRCFLRWVGAESEAQIVAAADELLADPAIAWDECGVWETDGPAVLMDSGIAGQELGAAYDFAIVQLGAGRWKVRAAYRSGEDVMLGVVQLLPA